MKTSAIRFRAHLRRCVALAGAALFAHCAAGWETTVPSTNGIGDVVALTNALKTFNDRTQANRANGRIWLSPGLYDLSGIKMLAAHLFVNTAKNAMIAGTGATPGETILLGGGETDKLRVLYTSGGTDSGVFTISNLTITGGYTTTFGGGVYDSSSSSTNQTTECRYCIITNNYAVQDGGGMGCGRAYNCLFADNTGRQGGGMTTAAVFGKFDGYGGGAWDCVFSNNVATSNEKNRRGGGGIHFSGGGHCERCTFFGNRAKDGSAITFVNTKYGNGRGDDCISKVLNCDFVCNTNHLYGGTGVVWCVAANNAIVSNCTFRANKPYTYQLLHGLDMFDCTISDHRPYVHLFERCNLSRCIVSNNIYTGSTGGYAIDKSYAVGAYTNVNCLFVGNQHLVTGHISEGKTLVNCTYANNVGGGANYGGICRQGQMFNCVFSGNKKINGTAMDVRMIYDPTATRHTNKVSMVNCAYTACDYSFNEADAEYWGFTNCVKTANLFVNASSGNYTLRPSSPARNTGLTEDWILALVGDRDLAGNPRVPDGRIDMGAFQHVLRGTLLIVR